MSIWDNHTLELHEDSFSNLYIDNLEQGMNLIGRLLKENNNQSELSEEFGRFSQLVETDFLEMAGTMGYSENASIFHKLILFQKRLEEFIMFPEIFPKKVVAVGGGFSAGKSKLINLLIGEELLPTDTTPTTSIPTYIMKGNETLFYAHNLYGLKSELDEEAIKAITHAFAEKYHVSLAQIMKNILLKSAALEYNNIAILDTPGYSKSDQHKNELNKDEHMARVHLQSADCLIWVIDIEKGTIPNQDFEFIQSMNISCPIFFVFNKADKKEAADIQKIIETARENVSNQGILCAGVGAISSVLKKEYGEDLLFDFLKNENEKKSVPNLKEEFLSIFSMYDQLVEKNILKWRNELKKLNEIALMTAEKQAQDLLKPLIAEKKKRIAREKDKLKQFNMNLAPFLSSIEKIQELLLTQISPLAGGQNRTYAKQFLHKLLKVNVKKMMEEKVKFFMQEITGLTPAAYLGLHMKDLFQNAVFLLEKDMKLKLAKEITKQYKKIKEQLFHKQLSDQEKEESRSVLSEIHSYLLEKIDLLDSQIVISSPFKEVLEQADTIFSSYEELFRQMLAHESTVIGNQLMEMMPRLYQETITTLIEEHGRQE